MSDYIGSVFLFYNYSDELADVSVHEDFSSDHFVVNFPLFNKVTRLKKSRRSVYNVKTAELAGLKSALRYLPWDKDIDASTSCWYDLFLSCEDEFVPNVLITDANRHPWID